MTVFEPEAIALSVNVLRQREKAIIRNPERRQFTFPQAGRTGGTSRVQCRSNTHIKLALPKCTVMVQNINQLGRIHVDVGRPATEMHDERMMNWLGTELAAVLACATL